MPQLRKEQFNVLSTQLTSYTYTVTAGDAETTLPVGFEMASITQVSGGDPFVPTRGIITSSPNNYVTIKSFNTGLSLSDSSDPVFGRLTYLAPNYKVTYYKLSSGAEVSAALPGVGTYDVTILFPEVMVFEEIPANSSVINVSGVPFPGGSGGGGGGGSNVIPDGGTISGTYDSDVFCQGDATVGGNLTVNGDLIVVGDLTNDSGYTVTVEGNLKTDQLLFNRLNPALPQGNIVVKGDLIFNSIDYQATPGTTPTLEVGGNLIGANAFSYINASGLDDANGADITVYGNINVSAINISGGASNASNAGNGGNLVVKGNFLIKNLFESLGGACSNSSYTSGSGGNLFIYGNISGNEGWFIDKIDLSGGDGIDCAGGDGGSLTVYGSVDISNFASFGGNSNDTLLSGLHDAGNGGNVAVYGDLSVRYSLNLDGGDGIEASGGNGGSLNISGDFTCSIFEATGGFCNSSNENHVAGSGGTSYVNSVNCSGDIDLSSGSRTGTLSSPGFAFPSSGGSLYVTGRATIYDFYSEGGPISTSGFVPCDAGSGGSLICDGPLDLSFASVDGGDSSLGPAGNGGNVSAFRITADLISSMGGDSFGGGNLYNGDGGNIGSYGDLTVSYVYVSGGYSIDGNGGSSGNISVLGNFTSNGLVEANGGNCSSTIEIYNAGSGGDVSVSGSIVIRTHLQMNGGVRSGATTAAYPFVFFPLSNAGDLLCRGSVFVDEISAMGGNVTTDYSGQLGGSGGQIEIHGNLTSSYVDISGGDAPGKNGGNGGVLIVRGFASVGRIISVGGDSVAAIDAGPANNGAGNSCSFLGGITAKLVQILDGAGPGAGAPATNNYVRLGGSCNFYSLDVTDRVGSYILPADNEYYSTVYSSVILKVMSMPSKSTLDESDGGQSASIAANLDDSIFINGAANWYKLTGAAV